MMYPARHVTVCSDTEVM